MSDHSPPWPGLDEHLIIIQMLAEPGSPHWGHCLVRVAQLTSQSAPDLHPQVQNDITQRVMGKVRRYLPTFRHSSSLNTWFKVLIRTEVANHFRDEQRQGRGAFSLDATQEDEEGDAPHTELAAQTLSVEQVAVLRELLGRVGAAIATFLDRRKDPERDRIIIDLWLKGAGDSEIAGTLGIPPYIVANVKYQLHRYLRPLETEWRADHFAPAPQPVTPHRAGRDPQSPEGDNGGNS